MSLRAWLLIRMTLLTVVCLPLALAYGALAQPASRTLTIAADIWCPINCTTDSAETGIGIETAQKALAPFGYKIHYVVMPWARALDYVRSGKVDAVVGANRADDATLIFPRTPIYNMSDDLYMLGNEKLGLADIASRMDIKIGVIRDYGYGKATQELLASKKAIPEAVQEVGGEDALEQNIRKLLAGRIDVIIESKPVMEYMLKRLKLEHSIQHVASLKQGNVYLAFSPALAESAKRARYYDEGMAKLKASGAIQAIHARYGLSQ